MHLFVCANCSTSISMNVDPARVIEVDGKKVLAVSRCWCDDEHGVLVLTSSDRYTG